MFLIWKKIQTVFWSFWIYKNVRIICCIWYKKVTAIARLQVQENWITVWGHCLIAHAVFANGYSGHCLKLILMLTSNKCYLLYLFTWSTSLLLFYLKNLSRNGLSENYRKMSTGSQYQARTMLFSNITNTNNVNKIRALLQTTKSQDEPNMVLMRKS
jgi:hypothetical protein